MSKECGEAVKAWAVVMVGRLERYLEAHGHLERKIVNRSRDVAKHLVLEPAKTRGDARQIVEAVCAVCREAKVLTFCTIRTPKTM